MNRNVEKAMFDAGKVESMMRAIENTYLDLEITPDDPDEFEKYNNGVYAFYLLWDAIKTLGEDIERLSSDKRIIDVIEAIKK